MALAAPAQSATPFHVDRCECASQEIKAERALCSDPPADSILCWIISAPKSGGFLIEPLAPTIAASFLASMADRFDCVQALFWLYYDEIRQNGEGLAGEANDSVRIDPKLIMDFAIIAEEGSFTRAARRMRVAQPWLSARLHKLEEILGFRLFERTTRRLSLTERGADFLGAAREVVQASEAADRLALQLTRSNRSILRIGAAPYTKILRRRRELIESFAASQPKVSLELETGWSHALMDRLDAAEIDLTFIMGDCWGQQFESIVIGQIGVALTLSRDHPLAAAKSLLPNAVAGHPIQVYTRSLYPELWDALYAPFIEAGAKFVEMPEMAEGPPGRMRAIDDIAAFFDFGDDDPGTPDVVRIPVQSSVRIPFQLMRRIGHASQTAEIFWQLTKETAGTEIVSEA